MQTAVPFPVNVLFKKVGRAAIGNAGIHFQSRPVVCKSAVRCTDPGPVLGYGCNTPTAETASGKQDKAVRIQSGSGVPLKTDAGHDPIISVLSIYMDSPGKSSSRISIRTSENLPDMVTKCNLSIVSHCRKIEIDRCVGSHLIFNGSQQGVQILGSSPWAYLPDGK